MIFIIIGFILGIAFFFGLAFLLGIASFATPNFKPNNTKKPTKTKSSNAQNKYDEKLEKEMNIFGLTEEEKEVARKGDYAPYSFEEEESELEEDDYYYDDS